MHYCKSTIYTCSSALNYTTDDQQRITEFLADELRGELCYIQTSDGKIVAIHYGMTSSYEGINIKRSIASTFQANFDSTKQDVNEADPSSIHTSHYRCNYTIIILLRILSIAYINNIVSHLVSIKHPMQL